MMITLLLVMLFLLQVILLHKEKIEIVNWLVYHKLGSMILNTHVHLYLLITELIKIGHTKIKKTLNTYTHLFNYALNKVGEQIDKLSNFLLKCGIF